MNISVTKLTDDELIARATSFTSGKDVKLTKTNKKTMYHAEHSPIRTQIWWIEMHNIPSYVSVHFARHNVGAVHFAKSNRKANDVVTRETPVNHAMFLNSQALMNIARKRLCLKADPKTVLVMKQIVNEILQIEPELKEFLVPTCKYRKQCPEPNSCNYYQNLPELENNND